MNIRDIPSSGSKRIKFLYDQIKSDGFNPELANYLRITKSKPRRHFIEYWNLYTVLTAKEFSKDCILITAHWDTVLEGNDNCLDNTASLYNLYRLHHKLSANDLPFDVVLAFTDAEEGCSVYHNGALEAATKFQPVYHIDLELTAGGTIPLVDSDSTPLSLPGLTVTKMPYNNCYALRQSVSGSAGLGKLGCGPNFMGSACLTLVSESDMAEIKESGYCQRWAQCHRSTDTFDAWLNLDEIEAFTDALVKDILQWKIGNT